jgi:hypothetical protein
MSAAFAKPIPENQLSMYKKAALVAFYEGRPFHCETTGVFFDQVMYYLDDSQSGEINESGEQPLITFSQITKTGVLISKITLVTTSDYKRILTLKGELFQERDVNQGNLLKPNLIRESYVFGSMVCTPEAI